MAVPVEYVVRINLSDGALEIIGPDKDWVDAKVEQLSELVSAKHLSSDQSDARSRKRAPRATAKRAIGAEAASSPAAAPRRPRGTAGRSAVNEELKSRFTNEVRKEFKEYITARSRAWRDSQPAQAAIIATFLLDRLEMGGVDQHDLYTVYTLMGERTPNNIRSQLTNAQQRSRYFSGRADGKMVLSHAGENFARLDSLDTAGDD